jgi:PhnB protein
MKLVHFYLNFPGTAREAIEYYEKVFGTKVVSIQTFRETPYAGPVPSGYEDKVMHAQLPITETVHLMASDSVPGNGPPPVAGNNFYVMVVAADKAEADRAFAALASGGEIEMPLSNAPWGPYFGMCRDKFGIQWMVSLDRPA